MTNESPLIVVALVGVLAIGPSCGKSTQKPTGADAEPLTPLQSVAAIVIPNCAVAGCHDEATKTHSMDLSTPEKIVSNWVNVRGLDHCSGLSAVRVIPGDPDGSLVVSKIEGVGVCTLSQRMPPPGRDALTAEQVGVIRAWIAAGAPPDSPPPEDGGVGDAVSGDGSDADDGDVADGGDGDAPAGCTATNPCAPELTCEGTTCGGPWECISHFDDTLQHTCAPETILFCGCDGVTFEASVTCPDRPWRHPGACDDGASCTKEQVECADAKPACPQGQEPSVVNGCWGACVPISSCRCLVHWMCPSLEVNTCLPDNRCGPRPPVDAGAPDG
jgi:hypothetical protein